MVRLCEGWPHVQLVDDQDAPDGQIIQRVYLPISLVRERLPRERQLSFVRAE